MAISAQEFLNRPITAKSSGIKCALCPGQIMGIQKLDAQPVAGGLAHDDCYYRSFDEELDENPICNPRPSHHPLAYRVRRRLFNYQAFFVGLFSRGLRFIKRILHLSR
jgi:hypothetical protein